MLLRLSMTVLVVALCGQISLAQNTANKRETKVREDRRRVESEGLWLYNDLDGAYRQAAKTGKPILVVLRCIPCEECVKLDDELVDNDPVIKPLLEQFVCVRIVGTNGLDLDLFQYDTDQSFAVFMINADKTIYGRFGTRSHRTEWLQDVSLAGMAEALQGALDLHKQYPANKSQLEGKSGKPLEFKSPELYPSLAGKFTDKLNYEGEVVKSCIHCHQIGEARREFYWHQSQPIPEQLMYPYPHPKSIGLILDPNHRATVKSVTENSPAALSDIQAGDEIVSLQGQPVLSMADVQWVLHQASPKANSIAVKLRRGGESLTRALQLPENWRRLDDTSWRVASWHFSRFALGGMRLESLVDGEAEAGGFLKVKSVGQYGDHATAKRVGFEKGDILLSFDGQTNFVREADLFAYVNEHFHPGDQVTVTIRRNGQTHELKLPIQK